MADQPRAQAPRLRISRFEGPLDLLCHLIDQNEIDITDIPIAEITDQYLAYLDDLDQLDMDLASDFLVMASTLLHIKSRLLLPAPKRPEAEEDPRDELVLRLLAYRRCKTLAAQLQTQYQHFSLSLLRLPEPLARLALPRPVDQRPISKTRFFDACDRLTAQNRARFQDQADRINHLLKREPVTIGQTIRGIWQALKDRVNLFFHDLFPPGTSSRTQQVVGFLALLELLRLNRIKVRQNKPFDVMLIQLRQPDQAEDLAWNGSDLTVVREE